MNKWQQMVADFHAAAQTKDPSTPTIPSVEVRRLRLKLIREELHELADAFGMESHDGERWEASFKLPENPEVLAADAFADLLYVVLGGALACGIDIEPVFEEVHRSNMTKFIDGHRRADGKWVKGPSYTPANIAPIIEAQTAHE